MLLGCRLQQDKENSVLLGETWKLQTNLLPAHYVCAWHSLSSLALSPTGFPKITICSCRASFGSLGNCPFSLPLWNSDASLSRTLLLIPICAARSQLPVSVLQDNRSHADQCDNPPKSFPGSFPRWSFPSASRHCLCLNSQSPSSHSVFSSRQDNAKKRSLPLHIQVLLPTGQQNTVKAEETNTKVIIIKVKNKKVSKL